MDQSPHRPQRLEGPTIQHSFTIDKGSPNFFIQGPQKISNALSGPKVY